VYIYLQLTVVGLVLLDKLAEVVTFVPIKFIYTIAYLYHLVL